MTVGMLLATILLVLTFSGVLSGAWERLGIRAAAAFRPNVHAHISARKARAYQLRVLCRSVRTPEGTQKNSFHRVGLALRVLADDNVQAAVRAEQKRFIVAKVIQFQPLNKHTLFYDIHPVFINSVK